MTGQVILHSPLITYHLSSWITVRTFMTFLYASTISDLNGLSPQLKFGYF